MIGKEQNDSVLGKVELLQAGENASDGVVRMGDLAVVKGAYSLDTIRVAMGVIQTGPLLPEMGGQCRKRPFGIERQLHIRR